LAPGRAAVGCQVQTGGFKAQFNFQVQGVSKRCEALKLFAIPTSLDTGIIYASSQMKMRKNARASEASLTRMRNVARQLWNRDGQPVSQKLEFYRTIEQQFLPNHATCYYRTTPLSLWRAEW
jgi:hypothetical protein